MINAQTAELNVSEELVELEEGELQSVVGGGPLYDLTVSLLGVNAITDAVGDLEVIIGGVVDAIVGTAN